MLFGLQAGDTQRSLADPGGPWGAGPLAPKIFFKIMQFSGNLKEKYLIMSDFWVSGPPWG